MSQLEFGIKGLLVQKEKFLAVHKTKITDDKYELPGGRMKFGETIEDTLKREMFEELGLEVKPLRILDIWNYMSEDETRQVAGIIYLCKPTSKSITIMLSEEHDKYKWCQLEDLSNMNKLFYPKMIKWNWKTIFRNHHFE